MTANPDNRGNGLNLGYFPFGDHPPRNLAQSAGMRRNREDSILLDRVGPQTPAECFDNDSYGNPENRSVQGIPHRFLRCCHARCAEKDKGACRTYVHELRQQYAFRVRINPRDQHSHGRHGQAEGKKKWQPIGAMWSGGAKIVDNR